MDSGLPGRRRRGPRADGRDLARPFRGRPPARLPPRRRPPAVRRRGAHPLRPPAAPVDARGLPPRRRDLRLRSRRSRLRRRQGRPRSCLARLPRPQRRPRRPRRRRARRLRHGRARHLARLPACGCAPRAAHVRRLDARMGRPRRRGGRPLGRPGGGVPDARRRPHALPRPPRHRGSRRRRQPPCRRDRRRRSPPRRESAHGCSRLALRERPRPLRGPGVRRGRGRRLRRRRRHRHPPRRLAPPRRGPRRPLGRPDAGARGRRRRRRRPPASGHDHPRICRCSDRRTPRRSNRYRALPGGAAMTRMLGSDAILRSLEAEGVEVMFGIPGGAILPTYDAIARGTTVRHVLARHEQGAGHMAEGYARASGKPGVAMATAGPGATNLVTPIADAWMDSTPLVCITGQVRSNLIGTDAFQEADATGITMPIVKHSWLVQDVRELPQVMKNAFHVARTGRPGPVLVDVAKDVQEAEFDFVYPDEADLSGWKPPTKVHERQVREAAKAIAEARQPIVYAGGGVLNGDACAELLQLVEGGALPAVVTLMGKGCLPDSHPLNYGAPGMHGSKYANWALNKCDLIIAVGTRFDDRVTGKVSAFAPGAKVIHFDIDAAEVGKIREADIPVVGPLKLALTSLTRELKALEQRDRHAWHAQLQEWKRIYPYKYRKAEGVLMPQTVVEALRDLPA